MNKNEFESSMNKEEKKLATNGKYTQSQIDALKKLEDGGNVLVTGYAGTGKTFVVKDYIEECEKKGKSVLVTAPTGIAALNIEGRTTHSAFGLKHEPAIEPNYQLPTRVEYADVIIIDEISALRADYFHQIMSAIKMINERKQHKIQIIVLGDFLQLGPVMNNKKKKGCLSEVEVIKMHYPNIVDGFSFESELWDSSKFHPIYLKEVVRQKDMKYIESLNAIRDNNIEHLDYINNNYIKHEFEDAIWLCPYRNDVRAKNLNKYHNINSDEKTYAATMVGEYDQSSKMVDDIIKLKCGARVIIHVNDSIKGYCNGSMGTVVFLDEDGVHVELDDGKTIKIEPYTWKKYRYKRTEEGSVVKEEVGSFTQLPLSLGYAITINKSQGLTFDKANAIVNPFGFAQVYVMLSRVKTIEGLHLDRNIYPNDIIVSKNALEKDRMWKEAA